MVKSETRRDAEILLQNPSPRRQKSKKQTMQKRDFENYQKRFRDFEILPKYSETHVFRGTIRHPCYWSLSPSLSLLTIRYASHFQKPSWWLEMWPNMAFVFNTVLQWLIKTGTFWIGFEKIKRTISIAVSFIYRLVKLQVLYYNHN